ncbi:MAG TPA: hypothetical protein VK145_01750 [Candidatus Nanoarchaeia archaeon]|nr:hypothetical protein [Candidatus Nanoarchaeia archaeon]
MGKKITVNDKMQQGYTYELVEPEGKNFRPDFKPTLSPKHMLELGVFGGRYMRDCTDEFPKDWFVKAKFHPAGVPGHSPELNLFGVDASQPLKVWKKKGWINEEHDPRGWFQWYCRYYMGRRLPEEDDRQIKRFRAITRHIAQLEKNCRPGDLHCRPVQRQAILHWAYDSRAM